MSIQDSVTTRFVHVLAVVAGLFSMVVPFYLTIPWADQTSQFDLSVPVAFAFTYALVGAAFSFFWPENGWRWGMWVSAAPFILFSFIGGGVWRFLLYAGLTVLPACAGAYAAARLHLKHVGTN